jgi:hypothetical protein
VHTVIVALGRLTEKEGEGERERERVGGREGGRKEGWKGGREGESIKRTRRRSFWKFCFLSSVVRMFISHPDFDPE